MKYYQDNEVKRDDDRQSQPPYEQPLRGRGTITVNEEN